MRTFKDVVKGIERAEKDVDKVLKVAKLQRCPKERREIDDFWYFLSTLILVGAMLIPLLVR